MRFKAEGFEVWARVRFKAEGFDFSSAKVQLGSQKPKMLQMSRFWAYIWSLFDSRSFLFFGGGQPELKNEFQGSV